MAWADDTWIWITESFNNREIAGAIWLFAVFVYCLFFEPIRKAIIGLTRAALQPRLLFVFLFFGGYVAALAWLYKEFGVWKESQIPATVLWYFLAGCSLLGRSISAEEGRLYFRKCVRDSISIIAVVEFIYVFRTFSLFTEIIVTPVVTVLGFLYAFSERDPDHAPVRKLLEFLLLLVAIFFVWKSVSGIWNSPDEFLKMDTVRSFLLPILMTIGSIPFFYIVYCYSQIEISSIRLGVKNNQSDEVIKYAKWKFLRSFAFKPWLLTRAVRQFHCLTTKTNQDVDVIIEEVLRFEREAKNPPQVDKRHGWSPHDASKFLAIQGLETSDFHEVCGGDWWASSQPLKLDDEILSNVVTYYLEGDEGLVTKLKLQGGFYHEFEPETAVEEFLEFAETLLTMSQIPDAQDLRAGLHLGEPFEELIGRNRVRLVREDYASGAGFDLRFEIENKTSD
tara:strand:- start:3595 stop:4944 length:1350 start_codon:yes stop_codon:yes gene_type:complete